MKDKSKLKIGFSFAWEGMKELYKTEKNFRIHLLAALLVVVAGLLMRISQFEWLIICITIVFVLVAEAFNSAIEKTVDYISSDNHPLAKQIKDIAAGAVLLTAIGAVIVGLIIFLPKIFN